MHRFLTPVWPIDTQWITLQVPSPIPPHFTGAIDEMARVCKWENGGTFSVDETLELVWQMLDSITVSNVPPVGWVGHYRNYLTTGNNSDPGFLVDSQGEPIFIEVYVE